jgi:hypothetical protein
MKTNTDLRGVLKARVLVVCLAVAAMAGFVIWADEALAAQTEKAATTQTGSPQAPMALPANGTLGDFMAIFHY